jgi:hypothetical protein
MGEWLLVGVGRRGHRLGWARIIALAIACGFGVALVVANAPSWDLEDMDAYWKAGLRVRDGLPLYPVVPDPGAADVFRYAPWFAWLWAPLTYLPKATVQVCWSAVLLGSIAVSLVPLLRSRSVAAICLVAIMGGLLVRTASTGNVHAIMIAALVYGANRRSGPIWIGLAASLKFVPLGYALIYLGRGEWRRALAALAVAVVLLAPALLYDLGTYPVAPGDSLSLLSLAGPIPWITVAAICATGAVRFARTRYAWLGGSLAVLAAIPRLALYDLTYLLVGISHPHRSGENLAGRQPLPELSSR